MAPLFGGGHENMVDPQIPQAMATLIGILMIHLAPDGGSSGRAQKTGGSNKSETKSHWPFEIHGYLWVLQDPAWTLALNMLIISYLRFQFQCVFSTLEPKTTMWIFVSVRFTGPVTCTRWIDWFCSFHRPQVWWWKSSHMWVVAFDETTLPDF